MEQSEITRLRRAVASRAAGEFHFPEAYGSGWDDLPIGEKVARGHAFLDAVRAGTLPGIEDTGTKAGGGRLYRKSAR